MSEKKKRRLSIVMLTHYFSLIWRSILFFIVLFIWVSDLINGNNTLVNQMSEHKLFLNMLWLFFAGEMVIRFFPSKIRSPGCQKQFERNYIKTGNTEIQISDNHATMIVALIWIVFNGVFGALHTLHILNDGFMLLLCCAYSVCDVICILFFCPFQTWFFKNRCCATCRIYNWDYAMMFTPLFFVPGIYTWSLLALSVLLMARWELNFYLHPERFSENTNAYLKCSNCTEKLCRHKKQLAPLWENIDKFTRDRIQKLKHDSKHDKSS
ncbi:MAG: hypothetical protein PUJ11_08335 [Eubacteriaceae bacterium]|nr:hypothetical protein [Eubacteriaceae bacterium]